MARAVNDEGAELAKDHPDRFGFFATVPLPAVDAAATEAEPGARRAGADGVILLAHSGDTYLGQPGQADLFAELDRRRAVVLVHPGPLPGPAVPGIPPPRRTSCSTPHGRPTCSSATSRAPSTRTSGSS